MIDPTPNRVYQGLLTAAEAVLYTVPALPAGGTRELIKEIIVTNVTASDAQLFLSIIAGSNPASANDANRISGGRLVVARDVIIFALTTPLAVGESITGKSDVTSRLCLTISTAKV